MVPTGTKGARLHLKELPGRELGSSMEEKKQIQGDGCSVTGDWAEQSLA